MSKSEITQKQVKNKFGKLEWKAWLGVKPIMCKTCGVYTRRDGSAYCSHCANKHKA